MSWDTKPLGEHFFRVLIPSIFKVMSRFLSLSKKAVLILPFLASTAHAQFLTTYQAQKPTETKALFRSMLTNPGTYRQAQTSQPPMQAQPKKSEAPVWAPLFIQQPEPQPQAQQEDPVDLQADAMRHDDKTDTVIATGNVIISQSGRTLNADKVAYEIKQDRVRAEGSVSLQDNNGDRHFADNMSLSKGFEKGEVNNLRSELNDGSHIRAEKGTRTDGNRTVMEKASYTPCDVCEEDPDKEPFWQIKADSVTHDKEEKRIEYDDAQFEFFGVPVIYTPYFAHSDGTVKRKSGFVTPVFGFNSQLGTFAGPQYYWDIAPDKDATIGVIAATDENPVLFGQWRQRWNSAHMQMNGSVTNSSRFREENGEAVSVEEEARGHLNGFFLWDINEKWRSGVNINWSSDDQYMRQYDIDDLGVDRDDNILENEIYAERFSGRNYASARLLAFQDIRIRDDLNEQPEILPEVIANFKGDAGAFPVVGGNWELNTSFLGLNRDGNDQDVNRLSVEGVWKRRLISDYGLKTDLRGSVRNDIYNTRDRAASITPGVSASTTENRAYSNFNIKTSYPLVKPIENAQLLIEPIVAASFSPDVDETDEITNEDSQDVQIDVSNLFEFNRYPGLDRVEDQSKVTYGFLTGYYGNDGSKADIFLGQSYRLQDDENPFPEGSGLEEQESDIVGRISSSLGTRSSIDYRFQLNNHNLSSQRHELDNMIRLGDLRLSTRYLYAKELEGTGINVSREQIRSDVAYDINEEWRLRLGAVQDLGEQSGLRQAYTGFDFIGQCFSFSLIGRRRLTDRISGDSNTEILFRIGLKNLAEFQASGLQTSSATE